MSCASSSTATKWGKFVCVYLRVVLFTASVLQNASWRLRLFLVLSELGGTIHRMELAMIAWMNADRPAPAAQPWARLELPQ